MKDLKNDFGTLDYAIVVAGVVDGYAGLTETNEEKMLYCYKTNTIGPLLIAQALVKNGLLQKGSVLVNLTSKVPLPPLQTAHFHCDVKLQSSES